MGTTLWNAHMELIGVLGELVDRTDDRGMLALLDKALGLAEAVHTAAAEAVTDALTGRFRG